MNGGLDLVLSVLVADVHELLAREVDPAAFDVSMQRLADVRAALMNCLLETAHAESFLLWHQVDEDPEGNRAS